MFISKVEKADCTFSSVQNESSKSSTDCESREAIPVSCVTSRASRKRKQSRLRDRSTTTHDSRTEAEFALKQSANLVEKKSKYTNEDKLKYYQHYPGEIPAKDYQDRNNFSYNGDHYMSHRMFPYHNLMNSGRSDSNSSRFPDASHFTSHHAAVAAAMNPSSYYLMPNQHSLGN